MGNRVRSAVATAATALAAGGLGFWLGSPGAPAHVAMELQLCGGDTLLAVPIAALWIRVPLIVGLVLFAVWLWRGDHAERPRVRAVLLPVSVALALSGAWQVIVVLPNPGPVLLWSGVVAALLAVLAWGATIRRLAASKPGDGAEAVLLDGLFGLCFGLAIVSTALIVAVAAHGSGLHPSPFSAALIAGAAIIAMAVLGVLLARTMGGRLAVGLAMAWSFGWMAVGRFAGGTTDALAVGWVAGAGALLVLAAPVLVRLRSQAHHRCQVASGQPGV